MNRIIVIGNGFDMAHNLKTGYKDFIDDYWNHIINHVFDNYLQTLIKVHKSYLPPNGYEDGFIVIHVQNTKTNDVLSRKKRCGSFEKCCEFIDEYNYKNDKQLSVHLNFKNQFFKHITTRCSLTNWVDIENEYYDALKKLLLKEDINEQSEGIRMLNIEFNAIKRLLENYLNNIVKEKEPEEHPSIQEAFSRPLVQNEIAICKQKTFHDSIFSNMFAYPKLKKKYENEIQTNENYKYLTPYQCKYLYMVNNSDNEFLKKNSLNANNITSKFQLH